MNYQLNDEQKALAKSIKAFIRRQKKKNIQLATTELHSDECVKIRYSYDNREWKYSSRLNWLPKDLSNEFDIQLKELRRELLVALENAQEIRLSRLHYEVYKADKELRAKNSNADKLNWNLRTM